MIKVTRLDGIRATGVLACDDCGAETSDFSLAPKTYRLPAGWTTYQISGSLHGHRCAACSERGAKESVSPT